MTITHPLRGTCPPGCRLRFRCHCGCKKRTALASQGRTATQMVKGAPYVFCHGHSNRVRHTGGGVPYSRNGVEAGRLRDCVRWLARVYGTQDAAARLVNVSPAWVSMFLTGRIQRVRASIAQRIVAAVLSHRRPNDPLRIFELDEPPRYPPPIRRTWNPQRGLFISGDRAKPLVRQIIRHLGGMNAAARALADFYDVQHLTVQKLLCRLQKGERRIRQGTLDHLEDFAEYIKTEVEAA